MSQELAELVDHEELMETAATLVSLSGLRPSHLSILTDSMLMQILRFLHTL